VTLVHPAVSNTLGYPRSVFQDHLLSGQIPNGMSVPISDLTAISWWIAIHNGVLSFSVGCKLSIDIIHFDS
jgi:hypothetical protein